MPDIIKLWWRSNGGYLISVIIGAIIGAGIGGIIWGVRLESRVAVIEARGSPQLSDLTQRITRVEDRQLSLGDLLKINGNKIDMIADELRKHELEIKK